MHRMCNRRENTGTPCRPCRSASQCCVITRPNSCTTLCTTDTAHSDLYFYTPHVAHSDLVVTHRLTPSKRTGKHTVHLFIPLHASEKVHSRGGRSADKTVVHNRWQVENSIVYNRWQVAYTDKCPRTTKNLRGQSKR